MLGAPVVGEMLEAEPFEHGRAVFGAALLAVKRDDAPGDQVVAGEQAAGGFGNLLWASAGMASEARASLRARMGWSEQEWACAEMIERQSRRKAAWRNVASTTPFVIELPGEFVSWVGIYKRLSG